MNIVKVKENKPIAIETKLGEVIKSGKTAFIGKCGYGYNYGDSHTLYLIIYNRIIQADNPLHSVWDSPSCNVYIDRYCDVEIKEL